jgi:hypothetical protein
MLVRLASFFAAITVPVLACNGQTTLPAATACAQYFEARYANPYCGDLLLPATEVAREEARFIQICTTELGLPGVRATAPEFAALAAQLSTACFLVSFGTSYNLPPGDLGADAACSDDLQCESQICAWDAPPDGGTSGCKTCYDLPPASPVTDAARPVSTPACELTQECPAGLYCSPLTLTCTTPVGIGSPCGIGDAYGIVCAPPLFCVAGTCATQRSSRGGLCLSDGDCIAGFACGPGNQCGAASWGTAGDPCTSDRMGLSRCLVGQCSFSEFSSGGTCPTVLVDGAVCDPNDTSRTCDVFASCINGACEPEDANTCE